MRPSALVLVAAFVVPLVPSCKSKTPTEDPSSAVLEFSDEGKRVAVLSMADLTRQIQTETFSVVDPYYGKTKTFRALPFDKVMKLGFKGMTGIDDREVVIHAKDGYTVPFRPALANEAGSYIAVEDMDVPAWEPIGPQRANPGPFYLVWKEPSQQNLETHPRPWQIATIEVARFETKFPHTVPTGEAKDGIAQKGYVLFRDRCFRCHAINREGGRVGPDLSLPKNVLEYRTEAEVRAYVKNPLSLRYGNMPPHPDLGEADLDAIVGYLSAMKTRKFDPDAGSVGGH